MRRYVVERMTAEELQPGAFSWETHEDIKLKPGSIHWAVVLLDKNGDQTDDDFSFYPTRREAKRIASALNDSLSEDPDDEDTLQ